MAILIGLTTLGCDEQLVASPAEKAKDCSRDLASCEVGDTGVGGGIVFSVGVDGLHRVVKEYAPSGWAKASGDPQLDWESARRVSQGYGPGGAHEWRLPSMAELKELYGYWKKSGDGTFSAALYWSSSPWGGGSAWYVGFDDGYEYHSFKESTNYVRPVHTD